MKRGRAKERPLAQRPHTESELEDGVAEGKFVSKEHTRCGNLHACTRP